MDLENFCFTNVGSETSIHYYIYQKSSGSPINKGKRRGRVGLWVGSPHKNFSRFSNLDFP